MSFDLLKERGPGTGVRPLAGEGAGVRPLAGEIVISTDTAFKNARDCHTGIEEEITLYVIHGILHLLGYDDHAPLDIQTMRRKEKELMNFLGYDS